VSTARGDSRLFSSYNNKMKKLSIYFFILAGFIFNSCYKNSEQYPDIYNIVGVYLPVEYIATLERTKHNPQSWAFNEDWTSHDLLIVDFHTITACDRFYDGTTEIYVWEIIKYQFEHDKDEIILIDDNKKRYKKISYDIYDTENYRESACNFIGKTVLDKLIKSGDIILEKDIITFPALNNKRFRIGWQAFDPRQESNLEFENIDDFLDDISLVIKSNEYLFYGYYNSSIQILWSKKL
jgi:hypothetical protein